MTEETRRSSRLRDVAWAVFGPAALMVALAVIVIGINLVTGGIGWVDAVGVLSFLAPALTFSIVGLIVALRHPGNPAGWLMLVIGACWSLLAASSPLWEEVNPPLFLSNMVWVLPLGLMGTHLLLRLPDGRLPSARWRWVSRASTTAIVLAGVALPPEGRSASTAQLVAGATGIYLLFGCIVASVISLVVRARRADADERHQIRWVAAGGLTFAGFYALSFVPGALGAGYSATVDVIVNTLTTLAYSAVPIGIGIAILKYRLYAIDVVIRKALVLATLAAFFTAVYAAVVGGVGAIVGSRSTPTLSFIAAAVVAIGFQPALARARRFADRMVYGKRSTPYEVLAALGERLGEMYASDDVLPRIARVLGEGVGAIRARVWLRVDNDLTPAATWPGGVVVDGEDDLTVEVWHQGEQLGALSVVTPANDPMDPTKERLVSDLAGQAGVVLRNVRLTEELRARIDDLQAAQKRLVAAQDEERRRLERNIHDGAQQQLVALSVKMRLAEGYLDGDPSPVRELLAQMQSDTNDALEALRDLARGIYPPLLADKGLAAALEAQTRKAPISVEMRAESLGRYPVEVEAAAYFSCLEALQNVAKYAAASAATVNLSDGEGQLRFEVTDDGVGFDPSRVGYGTGLQGIADRLGALKGVLQVTSSEGKGTTVVGTIPIPGRKGDTSDASAAPIR
ncbi:MAG TPA: histidine kinase [Actinomycetota bacterium]|nr:histidine kinase [Actinomycetota bacterium]